jgi:hypothetical protein
MGAAMERILARQTREDPMIRTFALAALVAAATLSAACGAPPTTEGTPEGTSSTQEAFTPRCDPPGRAPAGEHWDYKQCKWVAN